MTGAIRQLFDQRLDGRVVSHVGHGEAGGEAAGVRDAGHPAQVAEGQTFGLGSTDQLAPFQLSMNGLGSRCSGRGRSATPVAQQSEAATQVTDGQHFLGSGGDGLGVVVQAEPFQWSTSDPDGFPWTFMVAPTAQQSEESAQLTPLTYCPCPGAAPRGRNDGPRGTVPVLDQGLLPDTWGKTPGRKLYWT